MAFPDSGTDSAAAVQREGHPELLAWKEAVREVVLFCSSQSFRCSADSNWPH